MAGIRVPDAQYEAPTPQPEQAQVPMPKQPVANANMFGAAQAEAGEQAGQKVAGAAIDIAKDIIQQKAWAQTSQVFENRELMNQYADKLLNDTDTHMVTDPNGTERQVANGYLLRTGPDKVSPDLIKQQLQQYQNSLSPDGKGGGWLMEVAKMNSRYTDAPVSDAFGKLSNYNRDQVKRETAQTFQNAVSTGYTNSAQQPTMSKALDYVAQPALYTRAFNQLPAGAHVKPQEDLHLSVMNNFALKNIGKYTADQLKQQADDAMSNSKGLITPSMKEDVYATIDKANDAYQKDVKINQEHNHGTAIAEKSAGIESGKYNWTNANAFAKDPNLTIAESSAMYNAVMNVHAQKMEEIAGINKGGTVPPQVPITEKNLGIATKGKGNEENLKAYNDASNIVNSLSKKDASDKFVDAISNQKLTLPQLRVYSGMLALLSQYLPTKTEQQQDGKEIDPKGVPIVANLKTAVEYSKGKSGGTGLIQNYLDGVKAPNADPTPALTGAMRTHALQQNPKLANIPENGQVYHDKYGNRRIVYPDLHTEAIKKSSGGMNVPSSSSKSSTS